MPRITFNANLADTVRRIVQLLNGQLSFGYPNNPEASNLNCDAGVSLVVPGGSENVDVTASHGLGRVPAGYFVVGANVGGHVYDPTGEPEVWTSTEIILRATSAGTYRLVVF